MIWGVLVYVILSVAVFILLLISKKVTGKKKKILIGIAFALVFLVAAIRVGVGTDYYAYQKWFNKTEKISGFMNCGFDLMVLILKVFTNNSQWLFAVSAFIILAFMFKAAVNEQENYELSMLFFITLSFFFSSNNGVRQWLSIAILMYSIKYIKSKELWKFLLFVVIASTFHITAFVFIPLYWILNIKVNNKIRIVMLILCIAIVVFLLSDNRIYSIIKVVMPFYYRRYISTNNVLLTEGGSSIFPVLLAVGVSGYYLIFEKRARKANDYDYRINASMVLIVSAIVSTYGSLYARIAGYFSPMIIFLVPDVINAFDGKLKKALYITLIVGAELFMLYTLCFRNSHDALPYSTIFSSLF